MKLTPSDRRTLLLMSNLAVQWEETLVQSMTPNYGKPDHDTKKEIRACERRIRAFNRLRDKLLVRGQIEERKNDND